MNDLGEIFGLALAIAASPFPVIPAILLLFTTRPRATSLAFLGGWLVGIGAVTGAFALLADVVGTSGDSPTWLSWVRVVIGAMLVAYGVSTPVLTYAVVGDRVLPPLEKAKDWLTRNNAAVMAVVMIVIGLALLKNGLGESRSIAAADRVFDTVGGQALSKIIT